MLTKRCRQFMSTKRGRPYKMLTERLRQCMLTNGCRQCMLTKRGRQYMLTNRRRQCMISLEFMPIRAKMLIITPFESLINLTLNNSSFKLNYQNNLFIFRLPEVEHIF